MQCYSMFVRMSHYAFVKRNGKVALGLTSITSLQSLPFPLIKLYGGSAKAEDRERNVCHQYSGTLVIKGDQASWLSKLAH